MECPAFKSNGQTIEQRVEVLAFIKGRNYNGEFSPRDDRDREPLLESFIIHLFYRH